MIMSDSGEVNFALRRLADQKSLTSSLGAPTLGPFLYKSRPGSLADAGVGGLRRADVEARVGRVFRRRLAVLDVLQEEHGLVAHLGRPLADLALRQTGFQQLDLHRQRVGDDQGQ